MSRLQKRSISLYGHRTSIALEKEFWSVLEEMASCASLPLATFISQIDTERAPESALASVLRVRALLYALQKTPVCNSI